MVLPGVNVSIVDRKWRKSQRTSLEFVKFEWSAAPRQTNVALYNLKVYNVKNRRWETIKSVNNNNSSRYSYTLNSFKEEWISSKAAFSFKVEIVPTIQAFNQKIEYRQGTSVEIEDWGIGPKATFTMEAATIIHDGKSWDVKRNQKPTLTAYPSTNSRTPNTIITTKLVNTGGTNFGSRAPVVESYISDKAVLGSGRIQLQEISPIVSVGRVYRGGSLNGSRTYKFQSVQNAFILIPGKTYYFHTLIKNVAGITPPLGEGTHHFVWPFRFEHIGGSGRPPACPSCGVALVASFDFEQSKPSEPYQIFDFTGRLVKEGQSSSTIEENLVVSNLPRGIYIVKKSDKTRKVYSK